jgi:N-sulfoglucosamine sulfohydrolase
MEPGDVVVPPYLPDVPEVRKDILDYYLEIQRFDSEVGHLLHLLEKSGLAENTLVLITGDNGWPFPRSKANLYDSGTRQPLAVRWPGHIKPGQIRHEFISLTDLAPTFLEAARLLPPAEMTGRSFLDLLQGSGPDRDRDKVFVERERHAHVRLGNLSYPSRAVRTKDFLYIRNFRPDRWPAGDPGLVFAVGPYGDCDGSPSKDYILANKESDAVRTTFRSGFEKRPEEELYDVKKDSHQMHNVAAEPGYASARARLRALLDGWLKSTGDPRATVDDNRWDQYPYFGDPAQRR